MKNPILHFTCRLSMLVLLFSTLSVSAQLRISVIGNSVTEGYLLPNPATDNYAAQFQNLIGTTNYTVLNFGKSSMTMMKNSPDGKTYWNTTQWVAAQNSNPDIVIINLGLNDSKYNNWYNAPANDFRDSYLDMIDICKNLPSHPDVYICYPIRWHNAVVDPIQVEQRAVIDVVAAAKNVPIIDLWTRTSVLDPAVYYIDNLHPNVTGAGVVAQIFYDYFQSIFNGVKITSTPSATIKEGVAYSYTLIATGNPVITFSAPTLPSWLSFNASSGLLSGTPGSTQLGNTYNVSLKADNGTQSDIQNFTIEVLPANFNNIPSIGSTPSIIATKSVGYQYTIAATDIDGQALVFSASLLPSWLSFNPSTKLLSGTPGAAEVGNTYNVTLQVSDGIDITTQSFSITVQETATNLLRDPGFETGGEWSAWAASLSSTCSRSGSQGAKLTLNEAGIEQLVTGLLPNTTYTYQGYLNTASTDVGIGAKEYNGTQKSQGLFNFNNNWGLASVQFTTGNQTTAKVFIYRIGSTATVCGDDFSLFSEIVLSLNSTTLKGNDGEPKTASPAIYLDPQNNHLSVSFKENLTDNLQVFILDISGKIMYENTFYTNNVDLNLGKYVSGSGMFVVKLITNSQVFSKKIIKQ